MHGVSKAPQGGTESLPMIHDLVLGSDRNKKLGAKGIASSNKCLTSSNKKLLGTSASLLGARALLLGTRSY